MTWHRQWRRAAVGLVLGLAACGEPESMESDGPSRPARRAPELDGGLTWLNSDALRLADLRGKVVLLQFFEYSCVNCIRTFPYLQEWQRRYGSHGLVVIGVHTPQYGFSMDPRHVLAGARLLGLQYPIVVDSDYRIADAYENRFWPHTFLLDRHGRIRFDHTGEGGYAATEQMIQRLVREMQPRLKFPAPLAPLRPTDQPGAECYPITPELYLGRLRGRLGNEGVTTTNAPALYTAPESCPDDAICLVGEWSLEGEYVRHTRDVDDLSDGLLVSYRATEINAVLRPDGPYWLQIFAQLDGHWIPRDQAGPDLRYDAEGRSYLKVDQPRMYAISTGQPYGSHQLRLYSRSRGLSAYAFSFGTIVIPPDVQRFKTGRGGPRSQTTPR